MVQESRIRVPQNVQDIRGSHIVHHRNHEKREWN